MELKNVIKKLKSSKLDVRRRAIGSIILLGKEEMTLLMPILLATAGNNRRINIITIMHICISVGIIRFHN